MTNPSRLLRRPSAHQRAGANPQRECDEDASVLERPKQAMPDGVLIAVLNADPRKGGLSVMHVHFPLRTRLPVHSHLDERVHTVLSRTYYSSVGERFDATRVVALLAGTVS